MSSKVLLVEDERTLSGIVRDALETMDFSVELAYDGSEGLHRYFEVRPDILVVDVMMPKMSGFDMVKAIRQSDKETPILFLTAKTTVDDVVTGFNLGADDYLKKPFAIPELVVRMKTLLGRSGKRTLDQEKGQESYCIGEYQFTPESAAAASSPPRTSSCPSGATTTSSTPAASRSSSPACAAPSPKTPASASSTSAEPAIN